MDSLSLESCSDSGFTGVGSLHERLKLLARRSAKADGVRRGRKSLAHMHTLQRIINLSNQGLCPVDPLCAENMCTQVIQMSLLGN